VSTDEKGLSGEKRRVEVREGLVKTATYSTSGKEFWSAVGNEKVG